MMSLTTCCAGYNCKCPFLPEDITVLKDSKPELMHLVVHPKMPGVYFLGFVQAHGPMIPCVESQVPYVADLIEVGSCTFASVHIGYCLAIDIITCAGLPLARSSAVRCMP